MKQIDKPVIKAIWHACDLYDYVQNHNLEIVTIHDHVVNLSAASWKNMLIIGDSVPAKGPASIGLSERDFISVKKILADGAKGKFSKRHIIFKNNGESLSISWREGTPLSFAPERLRYINCEIVLKAVNAYMKMLAEEEIPCEAAVLAGQGDADNLFRKKMRECLPPLVDSLARGDEKIFLSNCRNLVGMGRGLTPDGDDLIHGALVAFHYFNYERDFIERIEKEFLQIALSTNLMGHHMLLMALGGFTPQPVRNFILSISRGKPEQKIMKAVTSIGFSTGYNIVLAILLFIKKYLDKENKEMA
ncbi:MAG: DUF2877 domain-containing protein [Bacillota bacterium]